MELTYSKFHTNEPQIQRRIDSSNGASQVNRRSGLSFSFRLQKRLLSSIFSSRFARPFLPNPLKEALDDVHTLVLNYYRNANQANDLNNSILKMIIKISMLSFYNVFTESEIRLLGEIESCCNELLQQFKDIHDSTGLFKPFHLIYAFNQCQNLLRQCQDSFHKLIGDHLSYRSHGRIDFIFRLLSDEKFLKYAFESTSSNNREITQRITNNIRTLLN